MGTAKEEVRKMLDQIPDTVYVFYGKWEGENEHSL